MLLPFVGDFLEAALENSFVIPAQFAEDCGSQLWTGDFAPGLDPDGSSDGAEVRGQIGSGEVYIDADAKHNIFDFIEFGAEFGEDAAELSAAGEQVIGPLDLATEAGAIANGAKERGGGQDGDACGRLGRPCRAQENGKPETLPLRREPAPAEAPTAFGLGLGKDDDALRNAIPAEAVDHVIGGGGFLKNTDIAANSAAGAEEGQEIIAVKEVWRCAKAVTVVRVGLDVVAEAAKIFDPGPNSGAADAEGLSEVRAGDRFMAGLAECGEDLGVRVQVNRGGYFFWARRS